MQKDTHNRTDTLYSLLSNIHTIVSLSIFYCPKTSDNCIRHKFYNLEIFSLIANAIVNFKRFNAKKIVLNIAEKLLAGR